MLLILIPFALVLGPIDMNIYASPVCLVLLPLPIKHVPVRMPEFPPSMCLVFAPPTFVLGAIRPYLDSVTVSCITLPLAPVDCTVVKNMLFFEVDLRIVLIVLFFIHFWNGQIMIKETA
jgi:hypothetical protein